MSDNLDRFGLALDPRNHALLFSWPAERAHFAWIPYALQHALVRTWNPIACRIWGHSTFGPWAKTKDCPGFPKTCMHCDQTWPDDPVAAALPKG